jgi:hypothetical protein
VHDLAPTEEVDERKVRIFSSWRELAGILAGIRELAGILAGHNILAGHKVLARAREGGRLSGCIKLAWLQEMRERPIL